MPVHSFCEKYNVKSTLLETSPGLPGTNDLMVLVGDTIDVNSNGGFLEWGEVYQRIFGLSTTASLGKPKDKSP